MKKMISPVLPLPAKHPDIDIAEQSTSPMYRFDPVTPIPPALEIKPFFTGSVPLPPSVNQAYAVGVVNGHHRIVPSPLLEQFKEAAALLLPKSSRYNLDLPVLQAIRSARVKTPLAVRLQVYFTTEWKRDLDGPLKFAIDAVFAFLGLNDNQVVRLEAEKLVDRAEPRIDIEIRCLAR